MRRNRTIIIFYFVTCTLYFILGGRNGLFWNSVVKILPLLILMTGMSFSPVRNTVHRGKERKALMLCMASLVFSMLGDVFGEMKSTALGNSAFLCQIISFAVAHIFYLSSFILFFKRDTSFRRNAVRTVLILILFTYVICFAMKVVPFIGDDAVRVAVPVYMTLIGLMAASSVLQCRRGRWWFISGAFFFILSDSAIAYRAFVGPVPNSGLLIMSTYYAAQFLLNYPYVRKNI